MDDASQVKADGSYDSAERDRFVAHVTGVELSTVAAVLDLHDEYLAATGIAHVGDDHPFTHYDPASFPKGMDFVDTEVIAADAVRFLGVELGTAQQILDAEFTYLEAKGLA